MKYSVAVCALVMVLYAVAYKVESSSLREDVYLCLNNICQQWCRRNHPGMQEDCSFTTPAGPHCRCKPLARPLKI
ncbi:hypothetical protein HUJ04_003537 [Dendroctonus ponderosae]|nr:hypothetical protein HUJ04_003536 [Dendroctonus ponderosae]KAH1003653.1 hypothetical protein HUJ04_003537 [Dendroctonus ponderosae]KAH1010207.1 hypothetical protein HUJ05_004538 [Dendroctonus ponderosae]